MKKLLLTLVLALSFSSIVNANNGFTLTKENVSFNSLTVTGGKFQTNRLPLSGLGFCLNQCSDNAVDDCIAFGGNPAICEDVAVEACQVNCYRSVPGTNF